MQNFLFRKNSHSASVVAKALPRPPESPPSPSPAPVRGSGSVSRIRRTAGGSPHRTDRLPQRPGYPKNSGERMHESRSAGTQTARGTGGTHPDKPVCPCAGGRNRRIRRYAKVRRTYGPTGPRKGFDGSPRNADRTPPNRPANRSAADECYRRRQKIRPLDRVHRAGATVLPLVCRAAAAKRRRGRRLRIPPEAGGSDAVRQNRHSRTYVQTSYEDRTKKRPDQSGHPDRHAIAPDTTHTPDTRQTPHTRQTRTSRDEPRTTRLRHGNDMPHTTEQLPDKQPCRERPHRTATNTVGSFGRDKSHNPERPFSSSAPPVTMPSTLPDTTFAAPRPDTTFAAPPDTAFPHRSRTIPSTPLRPVRYKSGTAAARTAESRSKLW